ncbi:MAG TPA: 30S ribosomal protein S2, partial [Candidatus Saccharimonadales bacterium]|nr:30S ribosomal protein S2 [Candidatus Saccharimonadales bacterium]
DLNKTIEGLEVALPFITETVASGRQVLFVGTKRQAKDIVQQAAIEAKMPYVTERWLGGMLTNYKTISSRIKRLKDLEERMANGELASRYAKLEVQRFQEEIDELNHKLGGIKDMNGMPGALFIVDVVDEALALREASKLSIPIVGVVDTNADPTLVTYPIPANDDAIKALQLITRYAKEAALEGLAKRKSNGEGK